MIIGILGIKEISLSGFIFRNHPLVKIQSPPPLTPQTANFTPFIFEFIRPSLRRDQGRHKQFALKLLSVNEFMRQVWIVYFQDIKIRGRNNSSEEKVTKIYKVF